MKYLSYILRNARRNPVRSLLTVGSMTSCLVLMMILASFFSINDEVINGNRVHNRIITLSSQGFAGRVPIARVREVGAMPGVLASTPLAWFGGKFGEETVPFAQFGVDPDTFFTVYDELKVPPDQLKAFREDRAACVVGRKLANDRGLKVGEPLPIKGDTFPVDLKLVIRGVYDGPTNSDLRMCLFHWDYVDEALKTSSQPAFAGNAGALVIRCKSGDAMTGLCRKIDAEYLNSDTPTRTQTEEAFARMFTEMLGDLRGMIRNIGLAVVFSLVCVAGNAMAMALRDRTTEIAVLKAIGFGKTLILFLVLAEAVLISGLGGLVGTLGSKAFFDAVDVSKYSAGFLPFFYVPWSTALLGLAASLAIGLVSGLVPAVRASRLSVVNGLRKVV